MLKLLIYSLLKRFTSYSSLVSILLTLYFLKILLIGAPGASCGAVGHRCHHRRHSSVFPKNAPARISLVDCLLLVCFDKQFFLAAHFRNPSFPARDTLCLATSFDASHILYSIQHHKQHQTSSLTTMTSYPLHLSPIPI